MITMTHKSSINDMPARRVNVLLARWITILAHAEALCVSGRGFFRDQRLDQRRPIFSRSLFFLQIRRNAG